MSDRIKTALEKALEKADALGKASPEELKRMEWTPQGNAIAGRFLRRDANDLQAEVARVPENVKPFVLEGLVDTLLKNVTLPRDARVRENANRALEGLKALLPKSQAVTEFAGQAQHLFSYYESALQQTYANFRQDFQQRLSPETARSLQTQLGPGWEQQLERLPQFQDEWRRVRAGLDGQYEQALQDQKGKVQHSA